MKFKINKSHLLGIALSFVIFLLMAFLYTQTTLFDKMEWGSLDFRFLLRDPSERDIKLEEGVKKSRINPRARKDIVILGVDENTVRVLSDQGIQWPFPWDLHAKFTRFVGSGNPLAIFFDIMFLDHKENEDKLADAVKEAKNVFLDYPFEVEAKDVKFQDHNQRLDYLNRLRFPVDPADTFPEIVEEAVPPTPKLCDAAKGIGFANVFPGSDKVIRSMPLIFKYSGWYYPNIDLVLTMNYFGIGQDDVEIKIGKYIKLKNLPIEKMTKPNAERSIVIPIDNNGFMDVNYIGGSGSFSHYSYYLFLRDGTMGNNNSLKDKIVLVAAYSATGIAEDEKPSTYGTTFGIEHHANALNTILNQDFLYKFSDKNNLAVMFVIALLFGLVISRVPIGKSIAFTGLFGILFIACSFYLFYKMNTITAMATPIMQMGLTFTLIIAYRVLTEQQEKKYIRQTFSKFVSKSVVDELLLHPEKVKLGGEKKILTVLFSDIRGFTSISEKLTPEQLVEHLNDYLQAMTEIVFKYDGTLDKYVGDEIMAFWGAPVELEDHAFMACKCAIEQIEDLKKMNEKWQREGKPVLNIGIGLNTGDMVVGNMGSASRMDYTLMGDMVNLGARLEGTNKMYGTRIIISEFTYEHVKDRVIVRELDLIRVKGKELPVRIYELVDIKE